MLLEEYDIKSAKDIEDALKDLLGRTIQKMLESEMDEHLGYQEYERSDNPDYRNGKKTKKIRGNFGETKIEVPQDRDGSFEPKIVKKRQKDISGISADRTPKLYRSSGQEYAQICWQQEHERICK